MANYLESSTFSEPEVEPPAPHGRFRMGALAVGSLLAGGLIAALWYRNTLRKLHEAEESGENPHFGIIEMESADDA